MFSIKDRSLLSGILCLLLSVNFSNAKTLDEELYEVDQLRAGFDTPFDEVEGRCDELLKKYTKPEEQAKIYFELAQVEGQSGFQRPEKAVEYVKKALEHPIDPLKKVRLYIYWGDAIQVSHRGVRNQELVAARRKAAMPYLYGLKETLQYDLPEVKPELPVVGLFSYDGPADEYRDMIRRHQEQVEARRKAEFERDMIQHRDVLTGQVSSMYSRFPWASDEIRELATKVLEDKGAVDRLMSAVDKAVQKRAEELGWSPDAAGNLGLEFLSGGQKTAILELAQSNPEETQTEDKEVFIPSAGRALQQGKGFVLDLPTGKLINPAATPGSKKAYDSLTRIGSGDIAWDAALITVRKAKALTVARESNHPLRCLPGRWCNRDRLPEKVELPYSVLVVSNEDVDYLITIREIRSDGINIAYRQLSPDEAQLYIPSEAEGEDEESSQP